MRNIDQSNDEKAIRIPPPSFDTILLIGSFYRRRIPNNGTAIATSELSLDPLDNAAFAASSQYVYVSSLSWKIVIGPRFEVSSERLEKPGIEPMTPDLQGE